MTTGRRFVPLIVVLSVLAWTTAQVSFAAALRQPQYWSAGLALVVLGGITPLIYAVNLRVLPVFSGRTWRSPGLLYLILALSQSGWLVFAGRATFRTDLETAGDAGCLVAGMLFVYSVMTLVRSPRTAAAPVRVKQAHANIDRVGRRFTALAGLYLMIGLAIGLALQFWHPSYGRWNLVWAHSLLVGWFMSMASGIGYHVLPRWSRRPWRHPALPHLHFWLIVLGLPLMLLALALDLKPLFMVAGPLQAAALIVFVWNILPLAVDLPALTRYGLIAAGVNLVTGVSLGAVMAIDPKLEPRLFHSHAEINLFGWAGLLAVAFGYYLFPRLAGHQLRWARLAPALLAVQIGGVVLCAGAWYAFVAGSASAELAVMIGSAASALGLCGFGLLIGATFLAARRRPSSRRAQAASTASNAPG